MKSAAFILAASVWALSSVAACPQTLTGVRVEVVTNFPAELIPSLQAANAAFIEEQNPRSLDCFTVHASVHEQGLLVTFVPRTRPEDGRIRGGQTSCGMEVSFLVDPHGTIIRRHFAR